MKRLIATAIQHTVFANVFLVILFMTAAIAATSMLREMFPEFSLDVIMVTMSYPGADPEEVEEGISRKIEEAIDGIEGVKRYVTVSTENIGRAVVTVIEGYPVEKVKDDVRNAIESISTFPLDAEKPIISELTIRQEVVTLALSGTMSERVRKELAEQIKDELQAIPGLTQVEIRGVRNYEIGIEVSEERLREYGLSLSEVADLIRRGSLNLSAGVMRTKGEELLLRTVGRKYTGADLASIVVAARRDGELVTLDRIATIRDAFTEDPIRSTFDGKDSVMIEVYKTNEEDAIAVAEAVAEYVGRKQPTLPAGITLTSWADRSIEIRARIDLLTRNGLLGLILVFLALWLFLELKLSFWVAMGIPISLSGALILMWALGTTVNQLSMFGMIMVLGIIVDDAIVVGEAIYVHRKQGDGPLLAATNGVMEVGMPVIAAVTTTIVAFIPLAFVSGVMGKFVGIIPVVVISALVVSLFEALFLLPAHLTHLHDPNVEADATHPWQRQGARIRRRISGGLEWFVGHVYAPFVKRAVANRYVTLAVALAVMLFTAGLVGGGFVEYVMFPDLDSNDIQASIEFPMGTPFEVTNEAVQRMEDGLKRVSAHIAADEEVPYIKHIHATVGLTKAGFGEGFAAPAGSHVGSVRAQLLPNDERRIHSDDIVAMWEEEVGPIPGTMSLTYLAIQQGPPGKAIEMWLQGDDTKMLLAATEEVKAKLRTYDGVYQIQDDYRLGKREVRIDLKPEARALGLTLDDLARQVYGGYFGVEALRLQRGRDDVRVKVRYSEQERRTLSELDQVRIRTPEGHEVPFYSVAEVGFGRSAASINRGDGLRRITITAEVMEGKANAQKVLADVRDTLLSSIVAQNPGFSYSFEGRQEESRDAVRGLLMSFPVAMVGIYVILATIFRSYVQPFVILMTVPFGIIGAIYGHVLMGIPIQLMGIFGMVALTGVVVNDAIILIEAVNTLIGKGVPVFEAITRGGTRRFRAIILTTLSTVGGVTPMLLERDNQAMFMVPMAVSLAAGVAFATILTLVFIPSLLGILNDFRRIAYYVRYRRWPTPEEVEPARTRKLDQLKDEEGALAGMDPATPAPIVG